MFKVLQAKICNYTLHCDEKIIKHEFWIKACRSLAKRGHTVITAHSRLEQIQSNRGMINCASILSLEPIASCASVVMEVWCCPSWTILRLGAVCRRLLVVDDSDENGSSESLRSPGSCSFLVRPPTNGCPTCRVVGRQKKNEKMISASWNCFEVVLYDFVWSFCARVT